MRLEDEGDSGSINSHFKKRIVGTDVMVADAIEVSYFSIFVWALLQESNWYRIDHRMTELINFGRNTGCSFFKPTCPVNSREFCSPKDPGVHPHNTKCSADYRAVSRCTVEPYSDGCLINAPIFGGYCDSARQTRKPALPGLEQTGPNSRCSQVY